MLTRIVQDGVTFVGECVNHFFSPKELLCPVCQGPLREDVAASGQAALYCSGQGPSCANPVKSFRSSQEMYRWRDSIWEVIARTCKGQG